MKMPKISVIIPVYNSSKTIGSIIKKLINQPYKNIEIIVIDDGSTDDSRTVVKKSAKNEERLVFITQHNAGASSARNTGLDRASGEYIVFIDSDDDFDSQLLCRLAERAANQYDFVACGISINGKKINGAEAAFTDGRRITKHVLRSLLKSVQLYGPCCKLYRRELIEKYSLRFKSSVKYGEDFIFVLGYLKYVCSFSSITDPLYEYDFHENGQAAKHSTSLHSFRARLVALWDYIFMKRRVYFGMVLGLLITLRWIIALVKNFVRKAYG